MKNYNRPVSWADLLVGLIFLSAGMVLMVSLVSFSHVMGLWASAPFIVLGLFYFVRSAKPG